MRRSSPTALLALTAPLVLVACATIAPPQPPSLNLPKAPTDLRAVRKGDQVILTWTIPRVTTDRQTIRALGPTRICRGPADLKECGTPVGEITTPIPLATAPSNKQILKSSYTDTLPASMESDAPSASMTYAVSVLNRDGRGAGLSNLARVPLAHTLPPPQDYHAQVTSQGIVLSWSNNLPPADPQQPIHYLYRVHRRQEGSGQTELVGELPPATEPRLTLTDSSFEWEKTYKYLAEIVTVIAEPNKPEVQVEGDDTPALTVFAHDVFPPAVPSGLQAVFSGPGQQAFIDLVWAPVSDVDLAGYNVYREEEGSTAVTKLNSELARTPAYRDATVVAGKRYSYWVSAVDVRGNESARSEEASESVP